MKSQPSVSEADIRRALDQSRSVTDAATALGTSRRTLYRWMEFYGIEVTRLLKAA